MSTRPRPAAQRPRQAALRAARGHARRAAGALALALGAAACIIPDAGITVEDEFGNPGAVRLVEPTPITPRANEACDERTSLPGCPRIDDTLPTGLIRPELPLCTCSSGRDVGLRSFEIFVEDPDVDGNGNPRDDIIGAFFLDMPPDAEDPRDYLAYINQLPPEEPASRYRASELQTIERPDPHLKAWTIGQPSWDLCNPAGVTDFAGLHTLRIIVTDRPWYRPRLFDAAGRPLTDEEGEPIFGDPVIGMPDLRVGATYDSTTYVFQCFDSDNPPEGIECNCEA